MNESESVSYDENTDWRWLEHVAVLRPTIGESKSLRLNSVCSRCDHAMDWEVEQVDLVPGASATPPKSLLEEPATEVGESVSPVPDDLYPDRAFYLACNCSYDHKERPSGLRGCGQAGFVNFHAHVAARIAGPSDRRWAQRAEDSAFNALPDIRSTAGKWAATVGTLTGLLALIGFAKTPSDVTALTLHYQALLGLSLLAGVLLAARATWNAALASQGSPTRGWDDLLTIRSLYRTEAQTAARRLEKSRRSAILALMALMLGVLSLWFAPRQPILHPLLVTSGGVLVCGVPVAGSDGVISVLPPGPSATPVAVDGVTAVAQVGSCR